MSDPTPGPWRVLLHEKIGDDGLSELEISDQDGMRQIACVGGARRKANADLICSAVNSHADLVAALRAARKALLAGDYLIGDGALATIDAALAKAGAAP